MSDISGAWDVVYRTGSLLWMAAWALVLGYAFSSAIQVFVKPAGREAAGRRRDTRGRSGRRARVHLLVVLVRRPPTRALWTKGARPESVLAFLFASTDRVVELAAATSLGLADAGWVTVLMSHRRWPFRSRRSGKPVVRWLG